MTLRGLAAVAGLTLASLAAPVEWRSDAGADEMSEALRPCTRTDLVGTWAVIRFGIATSARVDSTDPAFRLHQRYVFEADSGLRHLTSPSPITRDDHRAMLAAPPTGTWTVDDRGRLLVTRGGAPGPEVNDCQVLVAKVSDPRSSVPALPGDLLLTHYDDTAQPVARRLLRKLARFRG